MSAVNTAEQLTAELDIQAIRQQFPALAQLHNDKPVCFFDGPGGSQVNQSALDAMISYLGRYNANLGGHYFSSQVTTELMAQARASAQTFYNAASTDEIVFGANATSLAFSFSRMIANTWQPGDEIIVTALDHYSNVSPWVLAAEEKGVKVHLIKVTEPECNLDLVHLASCLNEKTRLVAFTYASNTTGTVVDVEGVVDIVKQHSSALTYIDAVHFAPHGLLDVQRLDCDLLVTSAYKYFGPHLGVLYAKQSVLKMLKPYKVEPAPDNIPFCFETGTQNFEAMAGFVKTIDYLAGLAGPYSDKRSGLEASFALVVEYEQQLARYFLNALQKLDGVELYGLSSAEQRTPTFAIRFAEHSPEVVVKALAKQNICAWNGHFYAKGLVEQLGLADKGGVIRIGCMHYNEIDELETLFSILAKFQSR
ncbi:cysteine desulfurase-like protein [Catenovulum sp. SM1970]|uniref:cysteine desulfurase-like protein n=1 Tax=Marinifaba aquimaris TaxID=2741323 RepID=UPI001571D8FC|nr:cysteine desulfurase-like protein [Marinifaba aquimaris]NTS76599.1 cysteine desulfurase-like protein [Marinifaba aquimaris]